MMKTRGLLLLLLTACSSTPTTNDGGGSDAATNDVNNPMDAASDTGQPPGPPNGFSLAAPRGAADIAHVSMALDDNGDPLISYVVLASPNRVEFVRWDRTKGAFTMPVVVESVGTIDNNAPHRETSIAYDASTKTIGIAYQKEISQLYTLQLALSTDGGKTFTPETASVVKPMVSSQHTHDGALKMQGGKTHLAYVQEWQLCTVGNCAGAYYITRTGNSGAFTRTALDLPMTIAARTAPVSIALDGSGAPAVSYFGKEAAGYNTPLYFVRPGSSAVKVTDSMNVQNDVVSQSLVFDGTKPRIAHHLVATANATYDMRFSTSNDGMNWSTNPLPRGGGMQQSSAFEALAIDSMGAHAVAANWTQGPANGCSGPILIRSMDAMTFTGCGPDPKTFGPAGSWVNLSYGSDRKLRMAFAYGGSDFMKGIVFWRE